VVAPFGKEGIRLSAVLLELGRTGGTSSLRGRPDGAGDREVNPAGNFVTRNPPFKGTAQKEV